MSLQIVIVFSCIYSCIICWWCLNRQKERRAEVPTDHHMSLRFFNFICCNKKRAKENNWWDYCFFMMLLPRVSRDILTKTGPGKKKKTTQYCHRTSLRRLCFTAKSSEPNSISNGRGTRGASLFHSPFFEQSGGSISRDIAFDVSNS